LLEFSYLCFLLFLFVFSLYLLRRNNILSPKKIRLFINILIIPFILRVGVLIVLTFIERQDIVYYLKYINYLYIFSIPLAIIVSLYIFLRDEKLKFNYFYIFIFIFLGLYIAIIKLFNFNVEVSPMYGYLISLKENTVINLIYLILLATSFIASILSVDKKFNNKFGIRFLLTVLVLYIVEYLLFLGGVKLYPYPIIGEGLTIITLFLAINTFK